LYASPHIISVKSRGWWDRRGM